jgi:hypothetical protein
VQPLPSESDKKLFDVLESQGEEAVDDLEFIVSVLEKIHNRYFESEAFVESIQLGSGVSDASNLILSEKMENAAIFDKVEPPDVRVIVAEFRGQALSNVNVVFSGIIPLSTRPELFDVWRLVQFFGGRCDTDIVWVHEGHQRNTTHLVASSSSTDKATRCAQLGIPVVHPGWLFACFREWRLVDLKDHILPHAHMKRDLAEDLVSETFKITSSRPSMQLDPVEMAIMDAELAALDEESISDLEDLLADADDFLERLFEAAKHIPQWVISLGQNKEDIGVKPEKLLAMVQKHRKAEVIMLDHKWSVSNAGGRNQSNNIEYMIVTL